MRLLGMPCGSSPIIPEGCAPTGLKYLGEVIITTENQFEFGQIYSARSGKSAKRKHLRYLSSWHPQSGFAATTSFMISSMKNLVFPYGLVQFPAKQLFIRATTTFEYSADVVDTTRRQID
jgi:hypothetical protein